MGVRLRCDTGVGVGQGDFLACVRRAKTPARKSVRLTVRYSTSNNIFCASIRIVLFVEIYFYHVVVFVSSFVSVVVLASIHPLYQRLYPSPYPHLHPPPYPPHQTPQ